MKKNVLVVDGDAGVREALGKVISQAGYEVATAADSGEAAELFEPERTGLLILDLDLPFKHAAEAFGPLTRLAAGVPILLITNQPDHCPASLMPEVGALMEKPVDVELFLKTIDDLLAEPSELLHWSCACRDRSLHLGPSSRYLRQTHCNSHSHEKTRALH